MALSAPTKPEDFSSPLINADDLSRLPTDFLFTRDVEYSGCNIYFRYDQPTIAIDGSWFVNGQFTEQAQAGLDTGLQTILSVSAVSDFWTKLGGGPEEPTTPSGIVVFGINAGGDSTATWFGIHSEMDSTQVEAVELANFGPSNLVSAAVEVDAVLVAYDARSHQFWIWGDDDGDRIFNPDTNPHFIEIAPLNIDFGVIEDFQVTDKKAQPVGDGIDSSTSEYVFYLIEWDGSGYQLRSEHSSALVTPIPHVKNPQSVVENASIVRVSHVIEIDTVSISAIDSSGKETPLANHFLVFDDQGYLDVRLRRPLTLGETLRLAVVSGPSIGMKREYSVAPRSAALFSPRPLSFRLTDGNSVTFHGVNLDTPGVTLQAQRLNVDTATFEAPTILGPNEYFCESERIVIRKSALESRLSTASAGDQFRLSAIFPSGQILTWMLKVRR